MTKKIFIFSGIMVLVAALVYIGIVHKSRQQEVGQTGHPPCLQENETVEYTIDEKYAKKLKISTVPTTIVVKGEMTGGVEKITSTFVLDNFVGPSLQVRKCGIYVRRKIKENNLDNEGVWHYDFSGKGESIFLLSLFKDKQPQGITYSGGFSIDPEERYLLLERSYLGKPDYAGVVKDLKTLQDVFVLSTDDIGRINPNIKQGIISLGSWSPDGRYLWGTIFNDAFDEGYIRVDTVTWKADVLSPPPDQPSGVERARSFSGYLAYNDFPGFFGFDFIAKAEKDKFLQEHRQKHLNLYNLFTKEKRTLAATSDPEWSFKQKWLTDTELEYYLPSGGRKIYKVQ